MPEARSERVWTYKDYLNWPEGERWELIEGTAYSMTPAPSWRHQQITGELYLQIRLCLEKHPCKTVAAPIDVRLAESDSADEDVANVVQPDVVVVCDSSKIDDRGIKGPPDIAIEVISPSSATRDTIDKRILYERYCVPEYWVVDVDNERVFVFVLKNNRYANPNILQRTDRLESVHHSKIRIDLERLFIE